MLMRLPRERMMMERLTMPTGAEEAAAAKVAVAILQMAQKQGLLDKLVDAFKKKHLIVVLGSTGTGKSNFIDSLRTLVPKAIDRMSRTQFATQHRLKLAGTIFDFVDTPGDVGHIQRR